MQGGAAFPSQILLEGYASSEVDKDVGHILSADQRDSSDSEAESVGSIHLETLSKCVSCLLWYDVMNFFNVI